MIAICKVCTYNMIEPEYHFILRCPMLFPIVRNNCNNAYMFIEYYVLVKFVIYLLADQQAIVFDDLPNKILNTRPPVRVVCATLLLGTTVLVCKYM